MATIKPLNVSSSVIKTSITVYVLTIMPLIALLAISYYHDKGAEQNRWQYSSSAAVNAVKTEISTYYLDILSDLHLLTDDPALFSGSTKANKNLAQKFLRFAKYRRSYNQLRFIDTSGQEIVRVNYKNKQATVVAAKNLQNKKHRYYFKETLNLEKGSVYVSRFDLNEEYGKVETPHKPVIRFAIPIFDKNNKRLGIVIINYLGDKLLQILKSFSQNNDAQLYLLNDQGDYLYSQEEKHRWASQLKDRPRFQEHHATWQAINKKFSGNILNEKGMYIFETVNQFKDYKNEWLDTYTIYNDINIVSEKPFWKLVAYIPEPLLYSDTNKAGNIKLLGAIILFILFIPLSVIWSKGRAQAKEHAQRNKLLAQVVEQSNELIYITDAKATILYANDAVTTNTGYKNNELIGKKPIIFKSGKHSKDFYQKLWSTINAGEKFDNVLTNRRKDGSYFQEMKTITPLKNDKNEIEYFVSTGRNITQNQQLHEREMLIANHMAIGIMHNIGNLMTSIHGFAEIALMTLNNEDNNKNNTNKVSEYLTHIIDSSKRANTIVENIRFTHYESFESAPEIKLNNELNNILPEFKKNLPDNVSLVLNQDDNIPPVKFTPSVFLVAVEALLNNAKDAIKGNGEITIELKVSAINKETCSTCKAVLNEKYVVLSISDTGSGIDKNIIENIWDPFFTQKEAGQEVAKTPGLGLSAVRAIMHAHGGHIILSSTPGKGSTFQLLFPVQHID